MQENNMKYVYLENLSVAICCRVSHYVTHINIFIPHLALFSQNAFSRVGFSQATELAKCRRIHSMPFR